MDLLLFETRRRTDERVLGVGLASLATHTIAITAAVYGTLHTAPAETTVKLDTTAVLLAAEQKQAPNLLRQAGIQGRVLLRAIVDTTGRAEPNSIEVVSSPHAGFEAPARSTP